MSRSGSLRVVGAVAVLAVALGAVPSAQAPAPGRPAPSPRPGARVERAVPFRAGEVLTYDVSWSNVLAAGVATVRVEEKRASSGSMAYYIVAEGQPTPLLARLYAFYYKADTLLDAYTLLPQRGTIYSIEGTRRRLKVTQFDHPGQRATYEEQTTTRITRTLSLPPRTQDALSAFYLLRALALKPGSQLTVPVSDSGGVFMVRITVTGREPIRAGIGTVTAWRITPVILDQSERPATQRSLVLWMSDDERRLPVKMQAELAVGTFDLLLRDARM